MDLNPYIDQLREDLTSAAAAGDDQTRQTAAVLSGAIEPAARLAIMNALSDLAAEVTTNLDGQVVDLRLDGRDVRVVVSGSSPPPPASDEEAEPPPPPPPSGDNGDISRITLRLVEEIKSQAEQAASAQGVSLNTFVSQAVQGALQGRGRGGPWDRPRRGRPGHGHGGHGHGHSHGGHGRGGRGGPWDGPGFGGWPGGEGGGSRVRGWVQG
ncbi:toxin-antitoxin system HicB family antitoxin [Saccharopolyspora rhizosphaerae]|uniref:Toxin-antitoxin system HicB family antitoxin n=1 Tax=Saccharopolyspora rhizosphaerae TaxID=2492662 RepID=A0A3R8QNA6_9PSEU|nr:toxin-antitoxin system HicB family antitoxin [Saccharopolyspora rhizosphaerae]RRO16120.1 toxin-antitoxin system HicB family antitoxin [Saccharopolyspora rhizosphaerae]